MIEVTGITFKEGGKVYYFAPLQGSCKEGTGVIVETARGIEYARVLIPRAEVEESQIVPPLKPIIRIATEKDEETHRKNLEKKGEAMSVVREKIAKHNLDMKLIDCEFTFDGARAVFYYSAPQRVDFRELVKDLSSVFRMRIELRQVGIRDEIKMLGGLAPCGRECCCASCMPDLTKVSIKMAKNQGLSLNPGKISGLCGRLMCCLSYENDYYAEACKQMPKLGSEVGTPEGKGTVVNINMLKMQVRVKIEDKAKDTVAYKDFSPEELKFRSNKQDGEEDSLAEEQEVEEAVSEQPAAEQKPEPAPKPALKASKGGKYSKHNRRNFNRKHGKGEKQPDKKPTE